MLLSHDPTKKSDVLHICIPSCTVCFFALPRNLILLFATVSIWRMVYYTIINTNCKTHLLTMQPMVLVGGRGRQTITCRLWASLTPVHLMGVNRENLRYSCISTCKGESLCTPARALLRHPLQYTLRRIPHHRIIIYY